MWYQHTRVGNPSEATCQRTRRRLCQIDTGRPATACYDAEKPLNITQRGIMLLEQDCSWMELPDRLVVYTSMEHFHRVFFLRCGFSAKCVMQFA